MIKKLAHLCFQTDRFEDMTSFYRDGLGLPIAFSLRLTNGTVFGHYFSLGETSFLEVFNASGAREMWGGDPAPKARRSDSHYQHFCLEVEGIRAERDRLLDKGITVSEVTEGMDGSLQAWIKDPDGNDIELMEYTGKSLQLTPKGR